MKRQFFSALLMGAMVVGATTTLQSCKDYDDDIQNLQQQIDANSKAIKAIEDLIKNGSVITNVAEADNGVTVTLSDGKKFTIANGKDGEAGTPGTAWTIGADGYWVKDGVKTEDILVDAAHYIDNSTVEDEKHDDSIMNDDKF